jgi:uncharacterized protein
VDLQLVSIDNPDALNLILGQSHFIKTVEDLHEALVCTVPGILFGLAFCEASGHTLVRHCGTDPDLETLAVRNAQSIGAGHSFILFLKDAFPINVLHAVRRVPEVCGIYCATANPVQVIVALSEQGRGILGVIDGASPSGVEDESGVAWRKGLLRNLGYKG